MLTLTAILLVLAFFCFAASAFGVSSHFNLLAAGLSFYMLSLIIGSLGVR